MERHRARAASAEAATSRPLRRNISVSPVASLATTCAKPSGNSPKVTPVAASTSSDGSRSALPRSTRQTAASPTSQIMYCGLITLLVVVNSSTAVSAASAAVAGPQCTARSRHTSSQPSASTLSPSAAVLTAPTQGPRNSMEP